MPDYLLLRDGRRIELPSEEEDPRIIEAALADPDAQPWSAEELAKILPVRGWQYPRELLTPAQRELYDRANGKCEAQNEAKAESK